VHAHCPGIEQIDFTRYRLFEVLEGRYGLRLDWGRRTFEAQAATPEIAVHLGISDCDPVMKLEQIVFLDDGSPIELSDVWLRGDRYRLMATVRRGGSRVTSINLR
jgi:GntR family transcriptional regulator